jgi:hypothetical protein
MKKIIYVSTIIILIASSILYVSCKKNNEDKDQNAAIDNATAENAFNDVFNQVDNAAKQTSGTGAEKVMQIDSVGCGTITISSINDTVWPKTLIIDFGSTYCLCNDGRYRKGIINAVLTGRYRDSTTVITITLDQYYVNNYHIEGTKVITNLGHIGTTNGTSNLMYSISVTNGLITNPSGNQTTWNSTRNREWIEGESTLWPNWTDDVYLITGSADGIDQNGNNYNVTIGTPLRVALDCKWIESGTLDITPQGLSTRTVDFSVGGGGCDDQASVTINGVTYNFTMH